jgi:hypothetical protein
MWKPDFFLSYLLVVVLFRTHLAASPSALTALSATPVYEMSR